MTFRNLSKITNSIYIQKYNHTLWKNGFLTFLYAVTLIIFIVILYDIILNHPNEQKDFNLFIGLFTITTVLLTSLITTLIQNDKRNNSIMNEYHDVFEYLRNLNWYLQSGYGRCRFLAHNAIDKFVLTQPVDKFSIQPKTKEQLETEAEHIKNSFDEMDTRIRNMINASSTFPSSLKNQIYITLDQSMKIFGTSSYMDSPHLEGIISDVFITTNYHVLLDSFLNKYADEEVTKVMGYCIDWLIFSVRELDILRQNSEK